MIALCKAKTAGELITQIYPTISTKSLFDSLYLNFSLPITVIIVPSIPKIIPVVFKIPSNPLKLRIFSSFKSTVNKTAHTGVVGSIILIYLQKESIPRKHDQCSLSFPEYSILQRSAIP